MTRKGRGPVVSRVAFGNTIVTDIQRDLALMEHAARTAGSRIMDDYQPGEALPSHATLQEKSRDNPLTKADLEADRLLHRMLSTDRPAYGWLSEETADNEARLRCERVWIVDPIDGTKEFIVGLPQFAVSIGLVERGTPIAGCVFNPARGELFSAALGHGAYLNQERLNTSQRRRLHGASCLASRSETRRGEWKPFQDTLAITVMGSIAYKLALVASGRFDLMFTLTPKSEWDFCAGALLVQEAGGTVSHKTGQPYRFNQQNPTVRSVLASNGPLHAALLTLLAPFPLAPDRHAVTECPVVTQDRGRHPYPPGT